MAILSEAGGVFEALGDKGWKELGQIRNERKRKRGEKAGRQVDKQCEATQKPKSKHR